MAAPWRIVLAVALTLGATNCRSSARSPGGGAEGPAWPERDLNEIGPGFDLVAFRVAGDPRLVRLADDHVLWVDAQNRVFFGRDFATREPAGFSVPKSVVGSEPGAVYWLSPRGELFRRDVHGAATLLWKTSWEVDALSEDRLAFWARLIDCRKCMPKAREEVWRIPKHGGRPVRFYSTTGNIVTEMLGDGAALYLNVLDFAGPTWLHLLIPVAGGGTPGPPKAIDATPLFVDEQFAYHVDHHQLVRVPKQGGPPRVLGSAPEEPVKMDSTDVYFEMGDALYAVSKSGGAPRWLADWSGDELRSSCRLCGTSADSVCLACDAAFYRVPKTPRPAGRRLVYQAGTGIVATEGAFFWEDAGHIVRWDRRAACDVYDDACKHVLGTIESNELVSSFTADSSDLYWLTSDGSLWRTAQHGGPVERLDQPAAHVEPPFEIEPLARSVALDDDGVYFVDFMDGAVVRRAKLGRDRRVLRALVRPRALTLSGDSLFVLAAADPSRPAGRFEPLILVELDKTTGEARARATLGDGAVADLAATSVAAYVSFDGGRLLRIPKGSGTASAVFPNFEVNGDPLPALDVTYLTASQDALYFMVPGQVLELCEGQTLPRVLASGVDGLPAAVVSDAHSVYFTGKFQHKWEHWLDLYTAPHGECSAAR